jgi:hypothetical protein
MLLGVGIMLLLQLVFTYARPMQIVFGTDSIGWEAWAMILGAGLVIFTLVNIEKSILWRIGLKDARQRLEKGVEGNGGWRRGGPEQVLHR